MFRFTIRDVLWLTVVVALGVGWWRERSHLYTEIEISNSKLSVWPTEPGESVEIALDENGNEKITTTGGKHYAYC